MQQTDIDRLIADELSHVWKWLLALQQETDHQARLDMIDAKRVELSDRIKSLLPELHDG